MPLKYEAETSLLGDCPPTPYSPGEREAYRLVFSDIHHENNFRPSAIIKPRAKWKSDEEHCEYLALSLFISGETLIASMLEFEKSFTQLRKRLGDHVAKGTVALTDGVMGAPDETGHFNLHEDSSCDLLPKFQILAPLP